MEDIKKEVLDLTDTWVQAEEKGDVTTLKNILAPDFIGIGPLGFTLTYDEWLKRHESQDLKYQSLNLNQRQLRIFADMAVLIGVQSQTASYLGNASNAQFRVTLVFAKNGEKWQIVNLQLSAMGPLPNFAKPS